MNKLVGDAAGKRKTLSVCRVILVQAGEITTRSETICASIFYFFCQE